MPTRSERPLITDPGDEHGGFGFETADLGIDGAEPLDAFRRTQLPDLVDDPRQHAITLPN